MTSMSSGSNSHDSRCLQFCRRHCSYCQAVGLSRDQTGHLARDGPGPCGRGMMGMGRLGWWICVAFLPHIWGIDPPKTRVATGDVNPTKQRKYSKLGLGLSTSWTTLDDRNRYQSDRSRKPLELGCFWVTHMETNSSDHWSWQEFGGTSLTKMAWAPGGSSIQVSNGFPMDKRYLFGRCCKAVSHTRCL